MWIKRRGVHEIVALNFPFRRHDFGCGGTGGNHIRLLSRDRKGRSLSRRLFPFPLPLVGRGWGGGRAVMGLWQRAQVLSFSRRDFCSHPSYEQATPKNLAASQPSSDQPGSGVPNSSRSGTAHERTNGRRKRKQNAERRVVTAAPAGCGARPAGRARLPAFHCGSRQGDSWSPRLSVRPRFWGGPERSVLYGRPNRGAETLRLSTGVTRAGKPNNPSPFQ